MAGRLLILGAGAHGRAVADLARSCGFTVAGFTDRSSSAGNTSTPVLGTDAELATLIRAQRIEGGIVGVSSCSSHVVLLAYLQTFFLKGDES